MKILKNPLLIVMLILALTLSTTVAYARPITDTFRGGLLEINNFFTNEAYKPYSAAIDFFFFGLLFIAIYMMGARYAFKEVKRPEQVIVILLGLMTSFLFVLAGFSATLLLPYLHWLLYLLLFILIWWLLKGIKNPFWRFLLALLLTLLIVALLYGLFNGLTAPEGEGFFSSLGKSFGDFGGSLKAIQFPEISGPPGIPDYLSSLFGQPSITPIGPDTLPITTTPKSEPKKEGDFWTRWGWLLILLALAAAALAQGNYGKDRSAAAAGAQAATERPLDEIINRINDIISRKTERSANIRRIIDEKNRLLEQGDTKHGYVSRLQAIAEDDIANLFLDESRILIEREQGNIKAIMEQEWSLMQELKKLVGLEKDDIYRMLPEWENRILQHMQNAADEIKNRIRNLFYLLRVLIGENINERAEDSQKGILWLIAFIYNLEKKQSILAKDLATSLFDEAHIKDLVKGKFREAIRDEATLEEYNRRENEITGLLLRRIAFQIQLLERLRNIISAQSAAPAAPLPTAHEDWPDTEGKHDPTPPQDPVFPIDPTIPRQRTRPGPTRHRDIRSIDLSPGFMPIKNQQRAGACAAFAGASIVEYFINKLTREITLENELSELFLWYEIRPLLYKLENTGIYRLETVPNSLRDGGICFEIFWSWMPVNNGLPTKFPQRPQNEGQGDPYLDASTKKIPAFTELPPNDPDSWIDELIKGNPILIAITVHEGFSQIGNQQKNFYGDATGNELGGHAVVIVGFTPNFPNPNDQTKGIPAFKIRNSWGKDWGEKGYIWVAYDLLPTLMISPPFVIQSFEAFEPLKKEPRVTITKPDINNSNFIVGDTIIFEAAVENLQIQDNRNYSYVWYKIDEENRRRILANGYAAGNNIITSVPTSHRHLGVGTHLIRVILTNRELQAKSSNDQNANTVSNTIRIHIRRGGLPPARQAPDFSLNATPNTLTIQQGGQGSSTITVTSLNGFNETVTLNLFLTPFTEEVIMTHLSNETATPEPNGATASTLMISVNDDVPIGTYRLFVTGVSIALGVSHNIILPINVTEPPSGGGTEPPQPRVRVLPPSRSTPPTGGNPPVALFDASPLQGEVPLTVQFTDESTDNPTFRTWSVVGGIVFNVDDPNPTYRFEQAGTYTVRLRVGNQYGRDEATRQIVVRQPEGQAAVSQDATLEQIARAILNGIQSGDRTNVLINNLQIWLQRTYPRVKLIVGTESEAENNNYWILIVLTDDGKTGIAIPTNFMRLGEISYRKIEEWFDIRGIDATQRVLFTANDIKQFARVSRGRFFSRNTWTVNFKGLISREELPTPEPPQPRVRPAPQQPQPQNQPAAIITSPPDNQQFTLNQTINFAARIENLDMSVVREIAWTKLDESDGEFHDILNRTEIATNEDSVYIPADILGEGRHTIVFFVLNAIQQPDGSFRDLSSAPITLHIAPQAQRIPTKEEIEAIIKQDYALEQLPEREHVSEEFRNVFLNLSILLRTLLRTILLRTIPQNRILETASKLLDVAVQYGAINQQQRDFLIELITEIGNGSLENAIRRLGTQAAYYFDGDAHIEIVADAFLRLLLAGKAITPEIQEALNEIKGKIQNIADDSLEILHIVESHNIRDNDASLTIRTYHKCNLIIQEIEDYGNWCRGSAIKLYIYLINDRSEVNIKSNRNYSIREAVRKIQAPVEFFNSDGNKGIDSLIKNEVVSLIDICHYSSNEELKAYIKRLTQKYGIEDTSPQIGEQFNPHNQEVISLREGVPHYQVVEVSTRGFRYKGYERKSKVVVGR